MENVHRIVEKTAGTFREKWGHECSHICAAPGRINIIGEHTDYTGGMVLPAAIDRYIVSAVGESSGDRIRAWSLTYNEKADCLPGEYDPTHPALWFRYVMGVLSELEKTGYPVRPFDISIGGDIPVGSGLSSSAALEMSILTAMEALNGYRLDDDKAALICRQAENNFIGVQCGIMDMLVSRTGKKDCAVMIDCSDMSRRYVRMELPGCSWLVIDSGKRRSLVNSEYNRRRAECEEALETARTAFPERRLENLKDLDVPDLPSLETALLPVLYRRVRHVVTENDRVRRMLPALENSDLGAAGNLLFESHQSLRDDYEVSCRELDMLVEVVSEIDGVFGARMMGAGFGGSIIVLAEDRVLPGLEETINDRYSRSGFLVMVLQVTISEGARILGCSDH